MRGVLNEAPCDGIGSSAPRSCAVHLVGSLTRELDKHPCTVVGCYVVATRRCVVTCLAR